MLVFIFIFSCDLGYLNNITEVFRLMIIGRIRLYACNFKRKLMWHNAIAPLLKLYRIDRLLCGNFNWLRIKCIMHMFNVRRVCVLCFILYTLLSRQQIAMLWCFVERHS